MAQTFALPVLRRRIIDLEYTNTQAGIGVAQRKRVEPRAQDHDLAHIAGNAARQAHPRKTGYAPR